MKKLAFVSTLGCLVSWSLCASGALAQSYNANGVDSRIIYGGNGLASPSGSYIGGGTMSASARGISQSGPQANPGLPRVSLGANIGTAGDNQYTDNRIGAQQNAQANRRQQGGNFSAPSLPSSKWGANIGTAGDAIRSDMNPGYYRNNQNNQQFIQNQMQLQQRYQPPSQIQQMIQSSNGGPLKYEGAGSNHVNY